MGWKKPLILGAMTLATLILAAWLLLLTIDFNRFTPRIIQAVRETTGLELAFHGSVKVGLGLDLRLLIQEAEIRNAVWGSRPEMVRMKRCELRLSLLRLIRGKLDIDHVTLVEPDVLLETDASGALNLLSIVRHREERRPSAESKTSRSALLPVRAVSLERGRLTYRDGRSGATFVKDIERLTLSAPGAERLIQLAWLGSLNSRPFNLEGTFGTPTELMDAQKPWPVDLRMKFEGALITVAGAIGDVTRFTGLSLRVQADGPSVSKLLAVSRLSTPFDIGSFQLTATVTDHGGNPALRDLALVVGTQDSAEARISGSIESLTPMRGIQFSVTAFFKDLSKLSKHPSKPLPAAAPLTLTGRISDPAPKALSMHDLRLSSGPNVLQGSVEMDWSGLTARTRLTLSAKELEVPRLIPSDTAGAGWMQSLLPMGPAELSLTIADPFGRPAIEEVDLRLGKPEEIEMTFRGRIMDLLALAGMDVSFNANGKDAARLERILGKPFPVMGPFSVRGHVETPSARVFACNDLSVDLGKNQVAGSVELNLAGEKPQVDAILSSQKLDLKAALPAKDGNREILRILHALGPITASFSVLGPFEKPSIARMRAHIGTKDLAEMTVEGSIQDLLSKRGVSLNLHLQGQEFGLLDKVFHRPMPLRGAFSLSGRLIDTDPNMLRLTNIEGVLGRNSLRGWVEAGWEEPFRIRAEVSSQGLDLSVVKSIPPAPARMLRSIGPWSLEMRMATRGDETLVESFQILLGGRDIAEARLSGSIQNLLRWQGVDTAFAIDGEDLANLVRITGQPMPLTGPFSLSGRLMDPKAGVYKIIDFKAFFGENDLAGTFEVLLALQRPALSADFSSRTLDLRPLFGNAAQRKEREAPLGRSEKSSATIFSQAPLPMAYLQAIDADLRLQAGQILLPRLALDNATVRMTLKNGLMQINPFQGAIGGGTADGRFALSSEDGAAKASLDFRASEVDLGAMLAELGAEKSIEGTLRTQLEVQTQGDSLGALMAGLNGNASFVVANGRIHNKYIDLLGGGFIGEVIRLINPFSQKEPFSELTCHLNRFDIQNGLATSRIWLTDTRYTSVRGSGSIDLGKEKIDMSFRMSPKKGIGIRGVAQVELNPGDFARAFKVGGTLAQPSVTVDPTGAATTIGKMLGGLALFGPLGLAAGLIDLRLGTDDPCLKALEAFDNGPVEGKSAVPVEKPSPGPPQIDERQQGH